jgi:predicted phosphodiesterase
VKNRELYMYLDPKMDRSTIFLQNTHKQKRREEKEVFIINAGLKCNVAMEVTLLATKNHFHFNI